MAKDVSDKAAVEKRLWDEIERWPTGMLGLVGGAPHYFHPMTATLERGDGRLWFFSYKDTDLSAAAVGGHEAMFIVQRNHKFYACVEGDLEIRPDRKRIDRYWNSAIAAWYPQGKDDPRLTLLRLEVRDAAVWIRDAGPVRIALEVRRAEKASKARQPAGVQAKDQTSKSGRPRAAPPGSFAP